MKTEKVTIHTLRQKKTAGDKITMLTAYDATFARLLDESGVDVLLVGDSLGMVIQGHTTTLPVTLEEMIYHTRAVSRGTRRAQIVGDMPFMSYQSSPDDAMRAAGRMIKEGGAEAIKLEGGAQHAELVHRLVSVGIPVMGHIGLTPQSFHQLGGFKVQGREQDAAARLVADAHALEDAGAYALVLEGIPLELAAQITEELEIPTIGIGAGPDCDGQVLVIYDLLGMNDEFKPKFVKRYENLSMRIRTAVDDFITEVKDGKFPSEQESFAQVPKPSTGRGATVSAIALAGGCSPSPSSSPSSDAPTEDSPATDSRFYSTPQKKE